VRTANLVFLILIFCLFHKPVLTQDIIHGSGAFKVDIDIARFYGDESQVFVELYYGIREHIITYKKSDSGWYGDVHLTLKICKDTSVVSMKDWDVPHILSDTSALVKGKTLVGIETMGIPVGDYRLVLTSEDSIDVNRIDSVIVPLQIKQFPPKQENFSDIELCSSIAPASEKKGMFYKNTLDVVPNASLLYGTGLNSLYYYVEAYNMIGSGNKGDVIIQSTVVDGMGKEISRFYKNKTRTFNSIVEYGKIDIADLNGGTYVLTLTLTDSLEHVYATAGKKFYVYRPGQPQPSQQDGFAATGDAASSEYALMNLHDIDSEYTVSRYIAADAERREYESLKELDAKRKFMFDFWKRRNPEPSSRKNSYKNEYLRRVEYANLHFSKGFRQGWKTDRGRVYIVYGPYDEIEENSNTAETNPYDIWHYNSIQGGVIFVFVDRNMLGQFQLVHSTHRDELHDESWYTHYAIKTE
jgi:GWxTD domain-containing protein